MKSAFNQRAVSSKVSYLGNPDQWLSDFLFAPKASGAKVSKSTVLSLSALYACWKIRSETFATFPFQVWRRDNNGVETLATDHYLYNLIHSEPNQKQSSFFYRQTKLIHFDSGGNAYSLIERNPDGLVTGLSILNPDDVMPFENRNRIWYELKGLKTPVNSNKILHVANFSFDGITGVDPITAQNTNLSLSLNAQIYGDEYLANGTHTGGVLESEQVPGPNKRESATDNVLKEWNKRYQGIDKVGAVPVLWGGMKYRQTGASPAEAMLMEFRSMTISEIARVYRVPEEMLKSGEKTTATKHEQLMLQLAQSMLPLVKLWESEYNRKLIPEREKGKVFVRLNMDGLMRADTEAQAKMLETLFKLQALSPDEARKLRGMPPRTDGRGGEYGLPFASNIKTVEEPKE